VTIQSAPDTAVVTSPVTEIDDHEDHERFTHIVLEGVHLKKGRFVPIGNSVVDGMINATPVRALCGKKWVPGRDPQRFPLCPTCSELAKKRGWDLPEG
jgi:hypothetical protein